MMTTTTQQTPTQSRNGQKRPGAPPGNRNAEKHGVRGLREASRYGMTSYALPAGCQRIGRDVTAYRRHLEDAVLAARGAISVLDASTINRATRCETKARLAARWLSREGDTMTCEQRIQFMREADNGTMARDRAVSDLALEEKHLASLWALTNGNHDDHRD